MILARSSVPPQVDAGKIARKCLLGSRIWFGLHGLSLAGRCARSPGQGIGFNSNQMQRRPSMRRAIPNRS